ncbi:MAG TPA: septal ring lytic transglycosylase RlpA family protein [Rubrivivax sp.]|nr:septal ring lytic transglycosylase RlpA family protein [Rubrivivax sp.]
MNSTRLRSALAAAIFSLGTSTVLAQATAAGAAASQPASAPTAASAGTASASAAESAKIAWYGRKFAGRKTASGEAFNPEALTMAHKTLPFGTRVKITNPKNNKSVTVRVNDRGPTQDDRVGDVSYAVARKLGMLKSGVIEAELSVVGAAPAKKR